MQQTLPAGVWLGLEKYSGNNDSVKYAFFKGENDSYTAKSTKIAMVLYVFLRANG